MGRDRIATAIGYNRRHIRNLAGDYDWKADGHDDVDLVRLHVADNLAKLAHLAARPARVK
jgi:hypothetical protein